MELHRYSVKQLSDLVSNKELTPKDILAHYAKRYASIEPKLNSVISSADFVKNGDISAWAEKNEISGAFKGIPILLGDNIAAKQFKTTCGSRMLKDFVPPYNATVTDEIEKQGFVILGKANIDEFSFAKNGLTSFYGHVKNPYTAQSSFLGGAAGCAAAVAAGLVPAAIGSDAGGDIRIPASCCGLVALKPTMGTVSRYGVISCITSMVQCGPVTRTVEDAQLLYSLISLADTSNDPACVGHAGSHDALPSLTGLRIGVPKELCNFNLSTSLSESLLQTQKDFMDMGAEIVEISLPSMSLSRPAFMAQAYAETASNLAKLDGLRYGYSAGWGGTVTDVIKQSRTKGFGKEIKKAMLTGAYIMSAELKDRNYLGRARNIQRLISAEYLSAFSECDAILTPVYSGNASGCDTNSAESKNVIGHNFCQGPDLAGLPGLVLPCETRQSNIPAGFQLTGPPFSEHKLMAIGKQYEKHVGGFPVKELYL